MYCKQTNTKCSYIQSTNNHNFYETKEITIIVSTKLDASHTEEIYIKAEAYMSLHCSPGVELRGKRFTVCTKIAIILGTVRFTIRGGRL